MDVGVEPSRRHQSASQVHAFGAAGIAGEVGGLSDRDDATIPREQRLRRGACADVDASAVKQRRAQ